MAIHKMEPGSLKVETVKTESKFEQIANNLLASASIYTTEKIAYETSNQDALISVSAAKKKFIDTLDDFKRLILDEAKQQS